ncbi:MAG: ABC transporter substrate-binding protein [Chloroflexi bacterium]|nr:ABC transporter substrate-binding protein [Chloroflexota bacterium]
METIKQPRFHRNVRKLSTRLALLLIAALVMAALSSCGSSGGQPSGTTKPTVVIGWINDGAIPEMVSMAKGYFSKRMNANIEFKEFDSGPAALAAIASGDLQIMTGIGNPPTVSAISHGIPLQVVWAQELYTTEEGLVVRSDSGINSLNDLKGKTVALVVGSTSELALGVNLKQAGIDPSSVHFLNMSPPAIRVAWSNHSIQAAYTWDPVLHTISNEGGKILVTDQNVEQVAPIFDLSLVNSNWAKSNANLVKGFVQAMDDGVTYYKQNPDDAVQVIANQVGITTDLAKQELAGFKIYSAQDELTADGLGQGSSVAASLVTKALQAAGTYLAGKGSIAGVPANLDQNVNPTYVESILNH